MDEVEEIKRRLDIVDFIGTYLTLKKAGANYRALCPFHQEKTASFMVSGEKQIFKCFGCGEGGDIFSFVMKMENLEFPEALRLLAERAGVQLKRRTFRPEEGRDQKTRLFELNNLAAKVFGKILLEHPAGKNAREYLKKRGLTSQTIKDFMVGFAPSAKFLEAYLIKKGYTRSEIEDAGSPNRFFRRIMFPIRDSLGNCLAFTGRATSEGQEPKYLNTADTIIFHKGRLLYNLDQARGPIKQEKTSVVVEGQMDVVLSFQAGVRNVVATSGTALTGEHLQILYRYTPNIIFAFDSDNAGLATAKKAYEMAIEAGFNVKMVMLGEFKDPGEMIARNPKLWQETIKNAVSVIDWYFEIAFKGRGEELKSQDKKEIAREILPVIKIIPDSIEQAHYVNLLAKRLGVNEEIVFETLAKVGLKKQGPKEKSILKKQLTCQDLILAILLKKPQKTAQVTSKIKESDFPNPASQRLFKLLEKEYNKGGKDLIKQLKSKASREDIVYIDNLIFEAEKLYEEDVQALDADLDQSISHLLGDKKEALKAYYAREIQRAEASKDHLKLKKLIKEFQEAISQ